MSSILFHSTRNTQKGPNWRAKRGDLLGISNIHFVAKNQKIEGFVGIEKFREKVSQCQKTFSIVRFCMVKRGATIIVRLFWPNGTILPFKIF